MAFKRSVQSISAALQQARPRAGIMAARNAQSRRMKLHWAHWARHCSGGAPGI
jgi:hypothetical protein